MTARPKATQSISLLQVDNLTVHVTRKKMKSIRLYVTGVGQVNVSAPWRTSDSQIKAFVQMHAEWIEKQKAIVNQSIMAQAENASKEEVEQWRVLIKALVPPLVEYWEPILGVKVETLAYRNMKSRWGSCQPSTGRVCINIRLALYPPECLEYVVVHELCHFLVPNHGPGFKYLLDKYLPDWRIAKQKLRS